VLTYASRSGTFGTINDVNGLQPSFGSTAFSLTSTVGLNVWINGAGGDWSLGTNWSLGHEPDATENAQIPDLAGVTGLSVISGAQRPNPSISWATRTLR